MNDNQHINVANIAVNEIPNLPNSYVPLNLHGKLQKSYLFLKAKFLGNDFNITES